MGKLHLKDLTPEQYDFFKLYCYNGVGSDSLAINPHDLIFKKAAESHDWYYLAGGTEKDRRYADKLFREEMLVAVKLCPGWKRPFYYIACYVYYAFVKYGGKYAFEYYPTPAESWEEFIKRYVAYRNREGKPIPWGDMPVPN